MSAKVRAAERQHDGHVESVSSAALSWMVAVVKIERSQILEPEELCFFGVLPIHKPVNATQCATHSNVEVTGRGIYVLRLNFELTARPIS